jgi:hypothetical protein
MVLSFLSTLKTSVTVLYDADGAGSDAAVVVGTIFKASIPASSSATKVGA